jgi:(4S)-4-hydroxy-5-phosphonooxypentane-2,3-dione isomerase
MIVLAVTWMAKSGKEKDAERLFRQLTEASRQEPGCLMYVVHRHSDDPSSFFIYEQYKDQAALDAHRQTPHFLEIARGSLLQVADRKDANLYTPLP